MTPTAGVGPRVVALGGGHGLSASLAALRRLTPSLTAVVTVADDGGSSGRLRASYPAMLAPGDLRMAVCALAGDSASARGWHDLLQHRFVTGELAGHAVGNLLLAGLLDAGLAPVEALSRLTDLVGACGRILPMTDEALSIVGEVVGADPGAPDARTEVHGQVALAGTRGRVLRAWLEPAAPRVSGDALAAIHAAEMIVLGPGSLITSQLPHLLVPELGAALAEASDRVVYVVNLEGQEGESEGLDAASQLDILRHHRAGFRPSAIVADTTTVTPGGPDHRRLDALAADLGARVVHTAVARPDSPGLHDAGLLADALRVALSMVQDGPVVDRPRRRTVNDDRPDHDPSGAISKEGLPGAGSLHGRDGAPIWQR